MASTEIQKVPGQFNLPAGWPRLEFPDITSGLVADWDAASLKAGALPGTGWPSSVTTAPPLAVTEGTAAPLVAVDSAGRPFVRFDTAKLYTTVSWLGDTTIMVTLRPDLADGNLGRVITGGGAGYRAMQLNGTASPTVTTSRAPSPTSLPGTFATGKLTAVIGRYGASEVDGIVSGGQWSAPAATPGHPPQTLFVMGANTATPPTASSYLHADVYRVQVWSRILSKADAAAALSAAAQRYKF